MGIKQFLFNLIIFSMVAFGRSKVAANEGVVGKNMNNEVSNSVLIEVADKIWKNECGGKKEGLTTWNQDENFASLGIGHFIWYPGSEEKVFKQTFPSLLLFMRQQSVKIPQWLSSAQGCPWANRAEFQNDLQSPRMQELRRFLFDNRQWQALFMAERLEKSLPLMLQATPKSEQEHLRNVFYQLFSKANGLYILLDYLNFKGEGTAVLESYKGQGWGLRHVLLGIPAGSQDVVGDFIKSAKNLLTLRVENSPPERNEQRWLKGWLNRIDTYTDATSK